MHSSQGFSHRRLDHHGHDQEHVKKEPKLPAVLALVAESTEPDDELNNEEEAEQLLDPKEHRALGSLYVHNFYNDDAKVTGKSHCIGFECPSLVVGAAKFITS